MFQNRTNKHFAVKDFFYYYYYTYNKQNLIYSDDAWSRQAINCNIINNYILIEFSSYNLELESIM